MEFPGFGLPFVWYFYGISLPIFSFQIHPIKSISLVDKYACLLLLLFSQTDNLCLLIGVFSQLTLNLVIDMTELVLIFAICFPFLPCVGFCCCCCCSCDPSFLSPFKLIDYYLVLPFTSLTFYLISGFGSYSKDYYNHP
jgi:hypothetical protein